MGGIIIVFRPRDFINVGVILKVKSTLIIACGLKIGTICRLQAKHVEKLGWNLQVPRVS